MFIAANLLFLLIAAALCVPVAMFCLEVLLALLPRRNEIDPVLPADCRVAVLIPAHNEELVIAATLRRLLPTLPPGARVVVVADNCHDATASMARACGAEVIERHDAQRRGKGYALDFGLGRLSQNPPDAVVFLDADCRVGDQTVALLGAAAIQAQRPVQGLNLCDPDPAGGALQMASGLAFRFKNLVRTVGLSRLAGLNHLMGTGMALPWPLIEHARLAGGNVVEDMQLGIDLALAGKPALFLPAARVDSPLPQQRAAARTQRTRWEHGHLTTLTRQTPRLLWLSLRHERWDIFWLALDLAVPPLSLLVALLAASALASAVWAWLGGSAAPLFVLCSALALLSCAVLAGWAAYCRQQIPLRQLLAVPLYVAAKLPIYLAYLSKRQTHWIRTERDIARS